MGYKQQTRARTKTQLKVSIFYVVYSNLEMTQAETILNKLGDQQEFSRASATVATWCGVYHWIG